MKEWGLPVELILLDPATAALTDFRNLEPRCVRSVELVASRQVVFRRTGVKGEGA